MKDEVIHVIKNNINDPYILSLFRLTNKNVYEQIDKKLSNVILRILHMLYKNNEIKIYRKFVCRDLNCVHISPCYIGLSECFTKFIIWLDYYDDNSYFMNDTLEFTFIEFLGFLEEIEDQIRFDI